MHACLRTPELLLNIFQHVHDDELNYHEYPRPPYKTLPGVARTCKDFTEPALDVIWSSVSSLTPLLKCIPEHRLKKEPRKTTNLLFKGRLDLTVDPNLSSQDLDRVRYHAFRIRSLTWGSSPRIYSYERIAESMFDRLYTSITRSRCGLGGHLLPNLRKLDISLDLFEEAVRPHLRLVWGPKLSKVSIIGVTNRDFNVNDQLWTNFAAFFDSTGVSQHIAQFSLRLYESFGYNLDIQLPKPLAGLFVQNWTTLSNLDLESFRIVHSSFVEALGLLSLEKLTMDISLLAAIQMPLRYPLPSPYFVNLKELKLVAEIPQAVFDLIQSWGASGLESLTIERYDRRHGEWDLREIFLFMGQHLPSKTLHILVVRNGDGACEHDPYKTNVTEMSYYAIRRLFPLTKLVKMCINLGGLVTINDHELMRVAQAWPQLRHFSLYEREVQMPSFITPRGVLDFANALPHLEQLTLLFNGTEPLDFPDQHSLIPHPLTSWDVCTSDCNEASLPHVLAYLQTAFPHLKELGYGWVYSDLGIPPKDIGLHYHDDQEEQRAGEGWFSWETLFTTISPRKERLSMATNAA